MGGSLKLCMSGKALPQSVLVSSRLMVYLKWEGRRQKLGTEVSETELSCAVTVRCYVVCAGKLPMIIIINSHQNQDKGTLGWSTSMREVGKCLRHEDGSERSAAAENNEEDSGVSS